ncbi:hypothetical protein KAI12_02315 [Candidatus Bathyarchaeota archaeon]|nr:hypothetical protein [Candidatus Bathyarchaeota archaeon]
MQHSDRVNSMNTMRYINVEQAIFGEDNDRFHAKVAYSTEEACELVEVGYE